MASWETSDAGTGIAAEVDLVDLTEEPFVGAVVAVGATGSSEVP